METQTQAIKEQAEPTPISVTPCRMYRNEFPEVDELVMVRVEHIDPQTMATVTLLEYNNMEGIILISEVVKKFLRSPNLKGLLQVGKQEVMQVISVNKEKGYIDLTKKQLKQDEIHEKMQQYNLSKIVHSIVGHTVAQLHKKGLETEMEDLYSNFIWPLYDQYEHAYYAFDQAAKSGKDIFEGTELEADVKDELLKAIKHRLALHAVKVQADVSVTCFSYEGVDAIKPCLNAAKNLGTPSMPIEIHLKTSPEFTLVTSSTDPEKATELLNAAVKVIQTEISKYGGSCEVKAEARVVA